MKKAIQSGLYNCGFFSNTHFVSTSILRSAGESLSAYESRCFVTSARWLLEHLRDVAPVKVLTDDPLPDLPLDDQLLVPLFSPPHQLASLCDSPDRQTVFSACQERKQSSEQESSIETESIDPSLRLVGLLSVVARLLTHSQVSPDRLSAHVDVDSNDLRSLLLTHFASDVVAMAGGDDFIDLDTLLGLGNEPKFSIQVPFALPSHADPRDDPHSSGNPRGYRGSDAAAGEGVAGRRR